MSGAEIDALRRAAEEIRRQAPGDPGCPEDIAYYDGHMSAARVVDEMADAIVDWVTADGHACIGDDCPGCAAALSSIPPGSGCRLCGCVMGDHNDPRQGGGCTNCGDCEGWL